MSRAAVLGLLAAAVSCWFFGDAVLRDRSWAFRDGAHFYPPLFRWQRDELLAGRLPLWNSRENLGVPALADGTSSLFYPPKLLFLLPWKFSTAYRLFLLGHWALGLAGAYQLARSQRATPEAASLAAATYALSGTVLFQFHNPVFLIGAGWLPWALWGGLQLPVRPRRGLLALSASTAMMVLGGDPQAAYHSYLLCGLGALSLRSSAGERGLVTRGNCASAPAVLGERTTQPRAKWAARLAHSRPVKTLAGIVAAGALAAGLAAAQIGPTQQWLRESERAAFDLPRSIYEVGPFLARPADQAQNKQLTEIAKGLCGPPQRGTHHEHLYHFSFAPWRVVEYLWPNVGGRMFPEHRRWLHGVPGEGRVWNASNYLGTVPLLLAACAWSWRRRRGPRRWWSWVAATCLIASFGYYGIGWVLHEITGGLGELRFERLGAPTGGLYWALVTLLPKYAHFRYPAKWLVPLALAVGQLAALGCARLERRPQRLRSLLRLAGVGCVVSLAAMLLAKLGEATWLAWLAQLPPTAVMGPLDLEGARADLWTGLAHTTAVLTAVGAVTWWWHRGQRTLRGATAHARRGGGARRWAVLLLCGIAVGEVAWANRWLLPTLPASTWETPSETLQLLHQRLGAADRQVPLRIYRGVSRQWRPPAWQRVPSPERLEQLAAWDRESLFPKWGLLPANPPTQLVGVATTLKSLDFALLVVAGRQRGPRREDGVSEVSADLLRTWGVAGAVVAEPDLYPGTPLPAPATATAAAAGDPRIALQQLGPPLPRVWIVERVHWVVHPRAGSPTDRRRQLARFFWHADGTPRQVTREIFLEASPEVRRQVAELRARWAGQPHAPPPRAAGARVIGSGEGSRVQLRATLARPGYVLLSDLACPGWQAQCESQGRQLRVPVLRANGVFRALPLPAGDWQIELTYAPSGLWWGGLLSLASTLLWFGIWLGLPRRTAPRT